MGIVEIPPAISEIICCKVAFIRLKDIRNQVPKQIPANYTLISTNNDNESQLATIRYITFLILQLPRHTSFAHITRAIHMPYDVSRPATLRFLRW